MDIIKKSSLFPFMTIQNLAQETKSIFPKKKLIMSAKHPGGTYTRDLNL